MLFFKRCKKCNRLVSKDKLNQVGYCESCMAKIRQKAKEEARKEFEKTINNLDRVEITIKNDADFRRNKMIEMPEIKYGIFKKEKLTTFVAIDTETTGIKVGGNRIIEFSAVKYVDYKPTECMTTLINPKINIPQEATDVNNITNDMVADKPYFYQVKDCFYNFIGNSPIVGHNISFDLRHIYASGLDLISNRNIYDTIKLEKENGFIIFPKDYKLKTLCDRCNIGLSGAHRSLADALATGNLFLYFMNH